MQERWGKVMRMHDVGMPVSAQRLLPARKNLLHGKRAPVDGKATVAAWIEVSHLAYRVRRAAGMSPVLIPGSARRAVSPSLPV